MAGPNQPGKNWQSWEGYRPSAEDYVQRELDKDMNVYDAPLDISGQVARYQGLSDFLNRQTTPNLPGGWEVKHQLMNNAPELISGPTNFSQAPYDWYDPRAMLRAITPELKADPRLDKNIQGAAWPNKPDDIYTNPYVDLVHTSSLLPHEVSHSAQARYNLRENARQTMPRRTSSDPRTDVFANLWNPNFSENFMNDLQGQFMMKDSPYYAKSGFGSKMDETLSFLMGREAELPAGKTLLDDKYSKELFRRNPGSYEQYTKARDKLKTLYKEVKR